jgi:hypothetical protein
VAGSERRFDGVAYTTPLLAFEGFDRLEGGLRDNLGNICGQDATRVVDY